MTRDCKTGASDSSSVDLSNLYSSFAEAYSRGDMPAAKKAFEIYWRASWDSEPFVPYHDWKLERK